MTATGVARRMWEIFRSRWRVLLLAGLVIFIPLGLIETADDSLQDAFNEVDDLNAAALIGLFASASLHAIGALLGEVLFAGVVTAVVLVEHTGERTKLRELLAELSLGRLALADILFVAVTIVGLLALIVPGLVFLVWFALIGPVIEVEHLGIRAAFGRSRALVRKRFWLVTAFVLPIVALDETLTDLAHGLSISLFGETFIGEWGAGTLSELFTSLPFALAVVVLYFELSGFSAARRSSPRTPPPASRRSDPAPSA